MIFAVLYIIDFEVDKPTNFCVPDCIAYSFKTEYCDQISTPHPLPTPQQMNGPLKL